MLSICYPCKHGRDRFLRGYFENLLTDSKFKDIYQNGFDLCMAEIELFWQRTGFLQHLLICLRHTNEGNSFLSPVAELSGLSGFEKEVLPGAGHPPTSDFPSVRGAVTFP